MILGALKDTGTLGVDIGRVILDREAGNDGGFVEGSIEALVRLVDERFGERVHLVSKCGPNMQSRILNTFEFHRFYEQTGIARERVHFCRERHQKAPICTELDISIFIDDRVEVLNYLTSVRRRIAFCPRFEEMRRHQRADRPFVQAYSWDDVLVDLLG
jgi:hypothetical protein